MKNFKDSIKLLRFNMTYNILFALIHLTVSFAVLIPLYYAFISLAVNLSGVSYLTKETVVRFFKSPSTYALIFIMLVFASAYIILNVSAVSYAYHRANILKKTNPFRMYLHGFRTVLKTLRPRNYPVLILVLCYLPVAGTVFLNFMLLNIKAPYVIDIIAINEYITIAVAAVYVLLMLYAFRYIFVIHIYNVEKVSFRKAVDEADETLKGKRFKVTLGIILWCILGIGLPALIQFYYTGPFLKAILNSTIGIRIAGFIYEAIKLVASGIYLTLGLPFVYCYICNTFYNLAPVEEGVPNIDDYEEYDAKKSSHKERKVFAIILVAALLLDVSFYVLKRYNVISINADYINKVTITAHRGDSKSAPENTLAAFEKAIENGADVIELDVRQTKDGEIVVMHDENLRRTCGVDKKVGKLTYAEIQKISAGAKFKGKNKELYENEKIPTLQEAIELIGDRAEVNIELKPAKTDKNLERRVAEIVSEYDYYNNCVVASLTYKSIKRIKNYDPEIKTIYVMAMAMGDFYNIEYADGFSIKSRFINNEVIKKAHKAGKDVYAWTIDDKDTLEDMMLLDVDSIITNDPKGIRRAMYENYYGDTLIERMNVIISNQF